MTVNDQIRPPQWGIRHNKVKTYPDNVKNKTRKKRKKEKTYHIFDFRRKYFGEFTKQETEKFFKLTWDRIRLFVNKPKKVKDMYFIKTEFKP